MIIRTDSKIIMKMSDTVKLLDKYCNWAEIQYPNEFYGHISKKYWYVPILEYRVIHDLHYNKRTNKYEDVLIVKPTTKDLKLGQTSLLSKVQHLLKLKTIVQNHVIHTE